VRIFKHSETIRLHRLHWFGHVQRMEENGTPIRVLCMIVDQQVPEVDKEIDDKMMCVWGGGGGRGGGEEWQEIVGNERNRSSA
jgi:hypothetical protein